MTLKHFNSLIAVAVTTFMVAACGEKTPLYKDSSRSAEERTKDLIDRMTLEEKLGQLICPLGWPMYEKYEIPDQVANDKKWDVRISDEYKKFINESHGGMLWATFRADPWTKKTLETGLNPQLAARAYNALQHYAIDSTRLGIPIILAEEAPHGHMAIGTTVFPTSIGLSATWDTELLQQVGEVIGKELKAQGATIGYGPVIDLSREPRWSRVEETYGEDVHLTSKMAEAMVRGTSSQGVISTLKHFVAYGIPEGGHNGSPSHIGKRDLEENVLPTFKAAIDAGAGSVMTSYNTIDGVPSTCNKELLTGVLRERWNFQGFVVSDLVSIDGIYESHGVAGSKQEAAEMAIEAGVDVDLGAACYPLLKESVEKGRIKMSTIDRAVSHVLMAKFKAGLFDNPYVEEPADVRSPEHIAVAAQAARESVTLLKNNGVLPLRKGTRIALIGPNADNQYNQLGDYTAPQDDANIVTMLEGLQNAGANVTYVKGCAVRDTKSGEIPAAVAAARASDVVVAVVGGSSARDFKTKYLETAAAVVDENSVADMEAGEGFDRSTLDLLGLQLDLLRALKATGKPLVVVYIEGRPLNKNWASQQADALLTLWYPGQEGGTALADVLLGLYNPAGRLAVSVPRSVGQLPVYYNRKLPFSHDYVEESAEPLYEFGYGLSYSTFSYDNLKVEMPDQVGHDGKVTVDVTNTGAMDGDEVVQVYVRDIVASTARPRKQLRAFKRVHVKAGETVTVELPLGREAFELVNPAMERVVEPGEFEILVGASSRDIRCASNITL